MKDEVPKTLTKDDAELAYAWLFSQYIASLHRVCNVKDMDPTLNVEECFSVSVELYAIKQCIFLMRLLKTEFGITMYIADNSEKLQLDNEIVWNRIEDLGLTDFLSKFRIR